MSDGYGITHVATKVGIDADTLRYYERRGVLPAPARDASGRRRYSDQDMHLIEVLMHLKNTGMPLARIAEFTRCVAQDPAGVAERLAILKEHREAVIAHLASWQASLDLINQKIDDYQTRTTATATP